MKQHHKYHWLRSALINVGLASITGLYAPSAYAAFGFTGVAAGDATSDSATVWTRAADDASPITATVTMNLATDNAMTQIVASNSSATVAANDYTLSSARPGCNRPLFTIISSSPGLPPATLANSRPHLPPPPPCRFILPSAATTTG